MRRQNGLTLIELMIGVVIIAIMAALAVPGFRSTIASIKVRSIAESVASGLQYARSEAVKRNQQTTFTLNSNSSWTVKNSAGTTIQSKSAGDGDGSAVTISPVTVTFTSLGITTGGATQVDLSSSSTSATYRVTVAAGGGVKMCNPSITSTSDPRHC